MSESGEGKLGLMGLVGVVAGSMIGGAIFALPAKVADGAGAGSVIIAWLITGVGMFFLANTFSTLAQKRPDLKSAFTIMPRKVLGVSPASKLPGITG